MRHGEHDLHCFNHGDCSGMDDLMRDLRQRIAEIRVSNEDGYRVRSAAIQVLFVKEGFPAIRPTIQIDTDPQVVVRLRKLRNEIRGYDNGRGEGEYFADEIDDLLKECGYDIDRTSG